MKFFQTQLMKQHSTMSIHIRIGILALFQIEKLLTVDPIGTTDQLSQIFLTEYLKRKTPKVNISGVSIPELPMTKSRNDQSLEPLVQILSNESYDSSLMGTQISQPLLFSVSL